MSANNKRRRLWPWLAAALVVNTAGAFALSNVAETRQDLHADQVSLQWGTPDGPAPAPETTPDAGPGTPAASFVAALAAASPDQLFGAGFGTVTVTSSAATTPACMTWPADAQTLSVTPTWSGSGGLTAQVLTTPTGAGTATVEQWRKSLSSCSGVRQVSSYRAATPGDAPAGFTATVPAGNNQVLTQAIWSRGDVVAVMTFAPAGGAYSSASGNDLEVLRGAVGALDATLTSTLAPVCLDLRPAAADALRNPANPNYVQYSVPASQPIGAAPAVERPAAPPAAPALPRPTPVEMSALAPVAPLLEEDWVDTDGDGVGDYAPPVAEAPLLAAPVLVDPQAFTTTGLAPDPGPAPAAPGAPQASVEYVVPQADPNGPGCGWAFTGASGPADSAEQLLEQAASIREAVAVEAAGVRSKAWVAQLNWAERWSQWAAKDAAYAPVRSYLAAKQTATAAYQQATADRQASLDAYELALSTPPAPVVEEPEAPVTPTPAPTKPTKPTTPPVDPDDDPTSPPTTNPTAPPTTPPNSNSGASK